MATDDVGHHSVPTGKLYDASGAQQSRHGPSESAPLFIDDISPLLSASSAKGEKLHEKTAAEIYTIMQQQGLSVMTFHTALELRLITTLVLSEMSSAKDEVFGDGLWIREHLHELTEQQRSAAIAATRQWDQGECYSVPDPPRPKMTFFTSLRPRTATNNQEIRVLPQTGCYRSDRSGASVCSQILNKGRVAFLHHLMATFDPSLRSPFSLLDSITIRTSVLYLLRITSYIIS
jgi:hypothetical protein